MLSLLFHSFKVSYFAPALFLSLKESQHLWKCCPPSFSHASLCSTSLMVVSRSYIPSGILSRTSPLIQLCGHADMTTGCCLELLSIHHSQSLSLIHPPTHHAHTSHTLGWIHTNALHVPEPVHKHNMDMVLPEDIVNASTPCSTGSHPHTIHSVLNW